MKLFQKLKIGIALAAISAVAVVVNAQVPSRISGTTTLGALSVTNNRAYSVESMQRVSFAGVLPADFTATVKRVSTVGVTNSFTVVGTGGAGSVIPTNIVAFPGDVTAVTGAGTNTGAKAEFIVGVSP